MGLLKGSFVFTVVFFIATVAGIRDGINMFATTLPYHAFIGVYSQDRLQHSCSGAVINTNFIITSSHCVSPYSGDRFRIILGSSNPTEAGADPAYDHKTDLTFFISIPTTAEEGSIALIKLQIEITFSSRIQPVELPRHNNRSSIVHHDSNVCDVDYSAIASGHLSSDQSSFQLQSLKMAIVGLLCDIFPCKFINNSTVCTKCGPFRFQ